MALCFNLLVNINQEDKQTVNRWFFFNSGENMENITSIQEAGRQLAKMGIEVGIDDPRSTNEILEDALGEQALTLELARWEHIPNETNTESSPTPTTKSTWRPAHLR